MNIKRKKRGNRLKNDLAWLDPDQDMVLEEDEPIERVPETFKESLSRGLRSFLAIIICIVIPALWYFDWNTSAFADRTSEAVAGFFDEGITNSIAPLPPLPPEVASTIDGSMVDYASGLNELGLLEVFSSPAVGAFYESGVTLDYLSRLKQANLADDFSFPAVISFFQNQIPLEYLSDLKSQNLLNELSFPAIIAFYQNNVTIQYLLDLKESGFLEDTSFPAVVAYFNNEVSVDFLNELKDRNLLDQLSFPAVVDMYKNR